ncbi:enoyl-CoA hydratase/isomerase family protein [Erythrobacter sp. AP23]|uniref:enoyl-CoA hydratase/isomerase family protein n=1 Tax=Erythrobacter sp. AP23 TaxID=499656 RepID=UPI00076D8893|nr:enoyl-CoA hydratase-related protein [Erythrobacter sp. AP23]KWV93789.1 hypothetical protein ASS64_12910 [Erythrobacter sp. AP23]
MDNTGRELIVQREGGVLFATLDRPEKRNALNQGMIEALDELADDLETCARTRILVIRGSKGVFCSGGDISGFDKAGRPDRARLIAGNKTFGLLLEKLDRLPQTVIAVAEGFVFGGGIGLICVADFVLVEETTRFSISETTLGVPPAQIAPYLVSKIGPGRARRLALTAERFDGREATSLGLADRLATGNAELETSVRQVIGRTLDCAPKASRQSKLLIQSATHWPRSSFASHAATIFADSIMSEEGSEGAAAFLAKRKPSWAENP